MTLNQTIKFLELYNRWRRGENIPQPSPTVVGQAIDIAVKHLKKKEKKIKQNEPIHIFKLKCKKCEETYWSDFAFPKIQLCQNCFNIFINEQKT